MKLKGEVAKLLKLYGVNNILDFAQGDLFLKCNIIFYNHCSTIYHSIDRLLIVIDMRNNRHQQFQDLITQISNYFLLKYKNEKIALMHIKRLIQNKAGEIYGNNTRVQRKNKNIISS